jgi:site-specific recombinase XerD
VVDLTRFEAAIRGVRAPRTATSYVRIAAAFLSVIGSDPVSRDVEGFLERKSKVGERRSPATRNQELAALRALSLFAQREGKWTNDPTLGIDFARVPIHEAVFFTAQELRRLFLAADQQRAQGERSRDVALLALLSQAGLRVHEVVGLDLEQVDIGQETLVSIQGKGGTIADIPMSPEVTVMLAAWIRQRAAIAHGTERALFVSRLGRRISVRSVERLIAKLRDRAGIAKRGSCHSLRHSMATISLELGTDIGTISEILRHSSVQITQRYIHCLSARRRDAVRRLASTIPRSIVTGSVPSADGSVLEKPITPQNDIDVQGVWGDVA